MTFDPPEAPPRVRTAVLLLWLSLAITLAQTIIEDYSSSSRATGATAVVSAIYGLVIFRASRRHNWGRWVLLVWTILATVLYAVNAGEDARPFWAHVPVVATFVLELVGIYMLFTGAAASWYRGNGKEASAL